MVRTCKGIMFLSFPLLNFYEILIWTQIVKSGRYSRHGEETHDFRAV